jgi:predicted enzyme related to lactoylglutathione lyase
VTRFVRYVLRTTDAAAARGFYDTVLGVREHEIVPLHEVARARGAQPHWLGCLGVDDLEQTVAAFVARGATRLGPPNPTFAVLRDPGGAVVGLHRGPARTPDDVVWHLLNTEDLPRAQAAYGWPRGAVHDLGEHGVLHDFSFEPDEPPAGAMLSIVGRAGRHPHWLFHFRVDDLDAAVARVRAGGGLVAGVFQLPDGRRIAVCDDPQGAAFALAA